MSSHFLLTLHFEHGRRSNAQNRSPYLLRHNPSIRVTDYTTRQFSTFTKDLAALRDWLKLHHCNDVCMESTGKYWIPRFNILESDCHVFVANPKYVKGIRGKKTDKKDSLWLCDLHKHGLVQNSFISPFAIRQIRDRMRYRIKLTHSASSEKNRIQNALAVTDSMLSSVVSDTFGKSSLKIISHFLTQPDVMDFDVTSMLHRNMKSKVEDVKHSIERVLSQSQADKMTACFSHTDKKSRTKWYGISMNKILGIQACRHNFLVKTVVQPCTHTTKGFMGSSTEFRMCSIPKDRDSSFS
ncbi:MAG: transposase [Negativicutes bacterium]